MEADFDAISEQKAISGGSLLRRFVVYVVEAVVVYAFVYWRISSLLRDKEGALSKVVKDNSKESRF